MVDYQVDAERIATLTLDMPDRTMNVFDAQLIESLNQCIEQFTDDANVKGIILTSGKSSFMAGADINMLSRLMSPQVPVKKLYELIAGTARVLRRLETCGKPVAVAINGTALGGGYELCLAGHYRVVADRPDILIGLPEVGLGLLAGGGGTQRLPRLIGIKSALELLTEGRQLSPQDALTAGLVHRVVPAADLLAEARRWLLSSEASAVQPWDRKGFTVPGGGVHTPATNPVFIAANALAQARTWHNYPAPQAILSCVYEGLQVPLEKGLLIEQRYFTYLLRGAVSKNIIRTTFTNKRAADKLDRRPEGVEKLPTRKLGILGAGLMGAGIAYVAAKAGIPVVLLDADMERAERGKAYSTNILNKLVSRGKMPEAAREEILARITPTVTYLDIKDCDLVIEAVTEERSIKADVTALAEGQMPPDAIYASNTSTLPITGLAQTCKRPENFVGMHFFSPVEKMPLVEVIVGKKTSKRAVAKALDLVQQIRKTPIVVNDSRGFFTSRVIAKYIHEGCYMLAEGVKPALIENAARLAGMPVGPLNLVDETKIDLAYHITQQSRQDLGDAYQISKAEQVIIRMYELGRWGKLAGKGFYEYPKGGEKYLWPGLAQEFPQSSIEPDIEDLKKRLLYSMAIDTVRCLEEKVLTDPVDGDIGAVFGLGFATYTGGPISLIDTVGPAQFAADCERLSGLYGPRFHPPKLLQQYAEQKRTFYPA